MQDKRMSTPKFILILLLAGLVVAGIGLLSNTLFPVPIDVWIEAYKGISMF